MDRVNMKTELGTKWFTFFTKVRPWISMLMTCTVFLDFIKNIEMYQQYWWRWVYLLFLSLRLFCRCLFSSNPWEIMPSLCALLSLN